jgi:hypothetical protein
MANERAEAPRAAKASRELERARQAQRVYQVGREALERRSVVRGLVALALIVLAFSVARAGLYRVFVPGWWKQW